MADKITAAFPKAIPNSELVEKASKALEKHGYGSTTLLATSLCCDEASRDVEDEFMKKYGDNFVMGGLAGFAFGGVTSFGAMAHHIPEGGSCLLVFGPHVGVDSTGKVGVVERRGRPGSGACCGSACAAYGHFKSGDAKPLDPAVFLDPVDSQQAMVVKLLEPYGETLSKSDNPMVELPFCLWEAHKKHMDKIVAAGCQQVHDGKIALLGGIQINTTPGMEDYFLPLMFEIRTNKNEKIEDLLWT